ncbi:hypothetical protein SCHPADRAFT_555303 [Schizopora paradoxa]|uniref:Zn(2)-C6 fungal-type domain-containing protein n=1 Tax=Schizopora paradoxa TaxID=27342 RepID=A0A0H2RDR4_9AGAM|nr:hypothetical protein SCHPADRAFT_555303 [Schizopora paradoxa]
MSSTITSSSALEHEESSHLRKQDVHQKMLRGNIACAECRRLKQRCDRKLPCSTCIQRKCEAICPIGTLSNGQHRKELHMASNQLRVTVSEMTHRITQLEEALQVEFRSHSEGVHPLLSDELLDVKRCGIDGNTHEEIEELEVINSMGLLALNEPEDDGGKFYGATGKEGAGVTLPREAAFLSLLPRSTREDQHWPFRNTANASPGELHAILELQLPSLQRALALSESFFDNLAKSFQLVSRERVLDFLIPKAYETRPVCFFMAKIDLHDLALLYMVFALGISVDPSNPASTAEGERYRHLARASLGLKCIFENTSLAAIQTICLMSCYNVIASNAGNNEEAWRMMYLAFNLGLSVGLHRDPARWYLSPDEIAARRLLFWEMYVVDIRKSIASGRPPRFSLETVDCEFPPDTEAVLNPDGSTSSSCWHMNFLLSKTVIAPIAKRLSAAQPPKYSELLEMDRQIREFDLSQTSSSQAPPDLKAHSHCIYGSCVLTLRDLTLLYLHRAYFAKALLDSPEDPLRSPYAASFLAAYRSAASVIRTLKRKLCVSPRLVLRHWPTWAHALCSSVSWATARPTTMSCIHRSSRSWLGQSSSGLHLAVWRR